jgi:hypothetical protein
MTKVQNSVNRPHSQWHIIFCAEIISPSDVLMYLIKQFDFHLPKVCIIWTWIPLEAQVDTLFVEEHNIALSRNYFMSKLKTLLSYLGYVHSDYSEHIYSLCIYICFRSLKKQFNTVMGY